MDHYFQDSNVYWTNLHDLLKIAWNMNDIDGLYIIAELSRNGRGGWWQITGATSARWDQDKDRDDYEDKNRDKDNFLSCPGQFNKRWPCHSVSEWVSYLFGVCRAVTDNDNDSNNDKDNDNAQRSEVQSQRVSKNLTCTVALQQVQSALETMICP